MSTGLYISASGAAAQSAQVDATANNLANVDTQGFKKDQPVFREYLSVLERAREPLDIPRGPIQNRDLFPLDGRDSAFVIVDGTYTQQRQGNLKVTHAPLDVAVDGQGFFEVYTPAGVRFTRNGQFKIAPDGRLVTTEGYAVLADQAAGIAGQQPGQAGAPVAAQGRAPAQAPAGPPEAARFINLKDAGPRVSITEDGEIYNGEDLVAKLSVVEFKNTNKLKKQGSQLFANSEAANALKPAKQSVIRQGVLEHSNVNPVEEMTNLIRANRLYELDVKAMRTHGEMMGKEANDVGKL